MFKFLVKLTHQSGFLGCRRTFPRHLLHRITTLAIPAFVALFSQTFYTKQLKAESTDRPNIVLILADDLGYGDLGCYGQQVIKTPRLDQMAAEGMKFTQFYAGNTVCAPSRSVLMTGRHMGHTSVRGNAGLNQMDRQSLRDEDVTVAEVLHQANYHNALIGKWGLGELRMEGHPLKQGFDYFYGYLNQQHAHNYYPEYLWRNSEKVMLRNEVQAASGDGDALDFTPGAATKRIDYSHDLCMVEAIEYVREQQSSPFFLYLALTLPHANNEGSRLTGNGAEVPDYGIYAKEDWPDQDKGQAAMITRMDSDVGRLLDLLIELNIDENTMVFFTSDNGPHDEARHDIERFKPSGSLRGIKRALYEGGIRVPAIAWMPGTVPTGTVSEHVCYAGDFLATAAEFANVSIPNGLDSISMRPTLVGLPEEQANHEYLYWEFYEQKGRQAVRFGSWKAVRQPMLTGPVELYDLDSDLSESHDVSGEYPDIVDRAARYLDEAHVPSPNWTVR
jgi:uncharacterized sulfatase